MKNNLKSYIIGFVLSLLLTLAAYFVVLLHINSNVVFLSTIFALAFAQLLVQLFSFLHLGQESGPRWKLAVLISTVGLIFIIVVGSIWIMNHLNYNMTPQQINQYINDQSG